MRRLWKTRTGRRRMATVLAVLWIAAVLWSWSSLPPSAEWLVATLVVPWVWLLWYVASAAASQHGEKYARDVDRIHHSGRPVPIPERVR